jgi:hypothetical protein
MGSAMKGKLNYHTRGVIYSSRSFISGNFCANAGAVQIKKNKLQFFIAR